jgi:hypothetical protein
MAAVLPAFVLLVDRRPRAAFGFLLGNAALFITFFDMLGFAVLLGCIRSTGHE